MPWKESSVVDERVRFVLEYERGLCSMAELCRRCGVTRETGYVWRRRYDAEGLEGLHDRSRGSLRPGNRTPEEIEAAVLELRREHMRWGPRKLKWVLEQAEPKIAWPAASTIGEMLGREGLAIARKKRRRVPPYTQPFAAAASAPNCVWCADFKGWFRTQDGERIDPLTLTDAHNCSALPGGGEDGHGAGAGDLRGGLWRDGLPEAYSQRQRSAVCRAGRGRGVAAVAVVDEAGHPAGAYPGRASGAERDGTKRGTHRTSKQENGGRRRRGCGVRNAPLIGSPGEYNEVRPHEALGTHTPGVGIRRFAARLSGPGPRAGVRQRDARVRRVQQQGQFRWRSERVFLSSVFEGERVGLLPVL